MFPDRRTSIAIADRITSVGMWKGQELSIRAWKSAWKNSGMPWHIAGVEYILVVLRNSDGPYQLLHSFLTTSSTSSQRNERI